MVGPSRRDLKLLGFIDPVVFYDYWLKGGKTLKSLKKKSKIKKRKVSKSKGLQLQDPSTWKSKAKGRTKK